MATTTSQPMKKTASTVGIEMRDGVAVVRVQNPPVNAISKAVREGLLDAFTRLAADSTVTGVVLTADGRTFMAGADIREFDAPAGPPFLPEVIEAIEALPQPSIAAIFGTALGGGFECALACSARIMADEAHIGLPEVKLGIIPGAGGTQRAMRLAGFEAAADLVTSGRMVGSEEALSLGLVDAIAQGDVIEDAVSLIEEQLSNGTPSTAASQRDLELPNSEAVAELQASVKGRARGQLAPLRALDLLTETAAVPFTDGLAREREAFLELRDSPQAKALRHVFLAERGAARPPELSASEARTVRHIGVVGGGLMGSGIGFACLLSGYQVTIVEQDEDALGRARARFDALFAGALKRGKLSADASDALRSELRLVRDDTPLGEADLVIEAVFEDMDVKREIFARLDSVTRDDAILASNTSYLDINQIADVLRDPGRMLGLHFFSPAHIMRLMEVVKCDRTTNDALATGLSVGRRLGKVPIITGVCDGFCGNRILKAYRTVAEYLVEDGVPLQDVDAAMTQFGFPMGPFAVQDMAGLEIAYANRKRKDARSPTGKRMPGLLEKLVEAGRLGQKNGKGWYAYQPGERRGQPDPEVTAIIQASAKSTEFGNTMPAAEIQRRLLAAIINEGARILQEGIVARSSDIDLVMIHGYGFPRHSGGPMFMAQQIGHASVKKDVEILHQAYGVGWEPAEMLAQ